ncbi:hypothetical protein J2X97_002516 [Epilithonimonas hungarica]|nr:hypothetical protein [Epilithonimonas hungarica]
MSILDSIEFYLIKFDLEILDTISDTIIKF